MEYINNEFMASFDTTTKDFFDKIKESSLSELVLINDYFLEPYLNFIYKNQNIFRASFSNPKSMGADKIYQVMILNILKPIMGRFQIPEEVQSYWIHYYISGITAIIRKWLNRNCKESIKQIKTIIIDCVRPDNGLLNKKFGE